MDCMYICQEPDHTCCISPDLYPVVYCFKLFQTEVFYPQGGCGGRKNVSLKLKQVSIVVILKSIEILYEARKKLEKGQSE